MPRKVTTADVKIAYQRVFLVPQGGVNDLARLVLGDLLKFSGAVQSPTQYDTNNRVDTNATLIAIGRADVWRHIDQMLNLPSDAAMAMLKDAIHVGVEHGQPDN